MKKSDMAKEVARTQGVDPGRAADQMDKAVDRIVRALRSGHPARLPGLGTITPGKPWKFRSEQYERR